MASNYTEHYGLCQWSPEDKFIREEFNGDNEKVDAALGALEGRTGTLERTVPVLGYNLMNLTLQSYYDGKYTGYKKAMLLDGFADQSHVESLSPGVIRVPNPASIKLCANGVGDRVENYGTSTWASPGTVSDSWIATGQGKATGVKLRFSGGSAYGAATFTVFLSGGGKTVSANGVSNTSGIKEQTFSFQPPLSLEGGVTYTLSVHNTSAYALAVYTSGSENTLGYHLLCTPAHHPTGTVTAVAGNTGVTATRALAWVRHGGGSVGVSLNGTAMERTGSQGSVTLQGQSCTESAYGLEGALDQAVTVRLQLDALGAAEMSVYDYGVTML